MEENYVITLNQDELNYALRTAIKKITKILYVYEQSLIDDNFKYRPYVYGVIMYISSLNSASNNILTQVIIDLNTLLVNKDLKKSEIRKIVLDSKNFINKMITGA